MKYNTWTQEDVSVTGQEAKLTIIKTLRLSEVLMKMIEDECKSRDLDFSEFMRSAAVSAIRIEASTGERKPLLETACHMVD
jgi:hypothetical protein